MKNLLLCCLFLLSSTVFAQEFKQVQLKTKISEVTVFLKGAQVSRSGKMTLEKGKQIINLKKLSPYIDKESIKVNATGNFTILSVNHQLDYLDQKDTDVYIDSLKGVINHLKTTISSAQFRLVVLKEKLSLLNENKKLVKVNSDVTITDLKNTLDFYDKELMSIKNEELQTLNKIEELEVDKEKIESQIADALNKEKLPTGKIEIRIDAAEKTKGEFKISYLVSEAGWFPNYDIRVKSVSEPIELVYKADVYQNTGVNWDKVKLKFSNTNPSQSSVAPQLVIWYLNYSRNTIYNRKDNYTNQSIKKVYGKIVAEDNTPLPGVSILVKGTSIGTVSDINGNYALNLPNNASVLSISYIGYTAQEIPINQESLNVKMTPDFEQLDEVVVSRSKGKVAGVQIRGTNSIKQEADMITTNTIENTTSFEFAVEVPYSIKSKNTKLTIDLNKYTIDATYKYYAVPKIDKNAFLIASLTNWNQYNLLDGEANLFFEDAYVGRTILDTRTFEDTLKLSLGRDNNIFIKRTKVDQLAKQKFIGSNKLDSRKFQIEVWNRKNDSIQISLFDQIPVAVLDAIKVDVKTISKGNLNTATGEIKWDLTISSQQRELLEIGYEVKYPRKEKVILE